jgi:hypothetical protein
MYFSTGQKIIQTIEKTFKKFLTNMKVILRQKN